MWGKISYSKARMVKIIMQRYVFNPTFEGPLQFIHPLQVKSVLRVLNEPFADYIDYVILFGGSLDLACGIDSDLDFYVISEHDQEIVYKEFYDRLRNIGRPFDILVSTREDFIAEAAELGTVENRILQKGLCLYAKTQDNTVRAGLR